MTKNIRIVDFKIIRKFLLSAFLMGSMTQAMAGTAEIEFSADFETHPGAKAHLYEVGRETLDRPVCFTHINAVQKVSTDTLSLYYNEEGCPKPMVGYIVCYPTGSMLMDDYLEVRLPILEDGGKYKITLKKEDSQYKLSFEKVINAK